ncbi:DUF383-domain-containing protein [Auriscalpium vulgare]|uniref:DUF383-domain-containing protein n=1 Tax=Auriscalpium vulgare TaxID=40419 RepID=A0ACB8RWY8_9AGAM|nr:DUF383-domain-containing protein [Auriscalpium vulgare]
MQDQLRELLPFLHDKNPQARGLALEHLLPLTPKDSPHRSIFFEGSQSQGGLQKPKDSLVVRDLKLLVRDNLAIAHDAFRALVNLSDSATLVGALSEPSFLSFLVSYIANPQATLADLAAMLLSNLTASPSTCAALLTLTIPVIPIAGAQAYPTQSRSGSCAAPVPYPSGDEKAVRALPLLVDAFVQGASVDPSTPLDKRTRKSQLHFLASVFANLSTSPAGRMYFLTPQHADVLDASSALEYPLAKLVGFTEHADTIRRGGVASLIKNCAFYTQGHQAVLTPDTETATVPPSTESAPGIDALPYILLPLAGPEEYDLDEQELLPPALQFLPPTKTREPDSVLRRTHVETLLLLCTTRWGREHLRANGVYEVVRALHAAEAVDQIAELVERLVNMLKRDEGQETGVDGQIEEVHGAADESDEDDKIEEV